MSYSVIVPFNGFSGWSFLQRTLPQQKAAMNASLQVKRMTDGFENRISSVSSAEQLFDDRELREVALSAFGMQDDMENRTFILRVLNSNLDDPSALANQLADKRYLSLAQTFGFGATGQKPTDDGGLGDQIIAALQSKQKGIDATEAANAATLEDALTKLDDLNADTGLTDDERWLAAIADSDLGEVLTTVLTLPDDYGALADVDQLVALRQEADRVFGVSEIADFPTPGLYVESTMSDLYRAATATPWSVDSSFAETIVEALMDDPLALTKGKLDTTELLAEGMAHALKDLASQKMGDDERWVEALSNSSLRRVFDLVLDLPDRFNAMETDEQIAALRSETEKFFGVTEIDDLASPETLQAFSQQFFGRMEGLRTMDGRFAADIVAAYQEQQFEISVGETDTTLRLALGLERELGQVNDNSNSTNDTRWFSIMSSESLREVFEKALGLPSSFGSLDLDQQLDEFKARSLARFGTSEVADFADPEMMDKLTTQFLIGSEIADLLSQSRSTSQIAMDLLSSIPAIDWKQDG